ncbi:MAG: lysophospholipid acyltransferase family protein [Gemmataceae bacterium]
MSDTQATTKRKTKGRIIPVAERRKPYLIEWFQWYVKGYLGRNFHSVAISKTGPFPGDVSGPVIVVLNHPSWWDPLLCAQLATLWKERPHYAPIDSVALEKMKFFEKLGFFGVDQDSMQGAAQFLATSKELMKDHNTVLWITGQGEFVDVRKRPIVLRPGVGHLASRLDQGCVIPLGLEYTFWTEKAPEALMRFGEPIRIENESDRTSGSWTELLQDRLAATLDGLAEEAMQRNPELFEPLIAKGKAGIGGVFDWWRRFRSWSRGEKFRSDHAVIMEEKEKLKKEA